MIAVEEAVRTLAGERDPLRQNAVTVLRQITELRRRWIPWESRGNSWWPVTPRSSIAFFDLQLYATGAGREGEVFRRQMAYFALVQAKEMAGLERACSRPCFPTVISAPDGWRCSTGSKAKEAERINDSPPPG